MLLYLDYLKGLLPCRNPEETAAYYEEILLFPKESARAFALGRSGHMEVVESSPVYAAGPTAFKDGANDIREYLTLPNDVEITSASASGNTLSVTWVKKSTNTDAEMAPYTVNAALKTNMIEVGNFTSGKIHNDLTVRVQGVNSTDQWEINAEDMKGAGCQRDADDIVDERPEEILPNHVSPNNIVPVLKNIKMGTFFCLS